MRLKKEEHGRPYVLNRKVFNEVLVLEGSRRLTMPRMRNVSANLRP